MVKKPALEAIVNLTKEVAELRKIVDGLTPKADRSVLRPVGEYHSMNRDAWLGTGTPWFTEGAKSWLERNISGSDNVLEFGAGRSTIFWAGRARRVTVVEASPDWFLWIYMHVYNNPEMMKRVRLHFVPCEWNPNFETGRRRYWNDNRQSLNSEDVRDLERDLITTEFSGNNVILFDGSLRGPVFTYQITKANFDEVDLIVIDNTELPFNSIAGDYMIPDNFVRHDFVAGSRDDVPKHQNGKHITSLFVRKDRHERSAAVTTETPTLLSPDQRSEHMLGASMSDAQFDRALSNYTAYIRNLGLETFEPRRFR